MEHTSQVPRPEEFSKLPGNRWQRLIVAGSLAAIAVLGPGLHGEQPAAPAPAVELDGPDLLPGPFTPERSSDVVTPQLLDGVEQLLALPPDPYVTEVDAQRERKEANDARFRFKEPDRGGHFGYQNIFADRQALARHYGVTIYDNTPYSAPFVEQYVDTANTPFATYFGLAEGYLEKFGVTLKLADTPAELGTNTRFTMNKSTAADLDTVVAKHNLQMLIDDFATYTQEYVDFVAQGHHGGLTITIATNAKSEYYGFASSDEDSTSITLNSAYAWRNVEGSITNHEMYHGFLNHAYSAAAQAADTSFVALNQAVPFTPDHGMPYLSPKGRSLPDIEAGLKTFTVPFYAARNAGQEAEACAIRQANHDYLAEHGDTILYASQYGGTVNNVEDRAEIGRSMPDGTFSKLLLPELSTLREKTLHVMAEFLAFVPRTAGYMFAGHGTEGQSMYLITESCTRPSEPSAVELVSK